MLFKALYTIITTAVFVNAVALEKRAISQSVFDDLVRYTTYSNVAYLPACAKPLGNTNVLQFSNAATSTDGFIARDDTRKEIVVAFRGSQQLQDFLTDADITLAPFVSPGVSAVGATVHTGFLTSYNSEAKNIISTVSSQLAAHSGYSLVCTGHSLGAALASICSVSLKQNFANASLSLFTFGQPRTGDANYAKLVDSLVGTSNAFRAVHTTDGVPTTIPQSLGYQHHSTEFFNFADPASTATVKQCSGDEDPTCSDSIPSAGIDAAHLSYFNMAIGTPATAANCN